MRVYRRNSPQAAARILAVVLTSDGHVCRTEDEIIEKLEIVEALDLGPGEFQAILKGLSEDEGLTSAPRELGTLHALFSEVDDPVLRQHVVQLCFAVAMADRHLAERECATLGELLHQWYPYHEQKMW